MTQVYILQDFGLMDYLQFDGYAYRFVPILTPYRQAGEVGRIDPEYAVPLLLDVFRYGNLDDEKVYSDYFTQYNLSAARAREAFARALFGPAHPYGITWPETAYDDLTRDDLLDFYARHYTARNCFVVCSGAADAAVVDAVAEVAGQLPAGADRAAEPFPPAVTTSHAAVPHAGAVQSSIRIGRLLFGRNHPDYVGMQVVAMLLGGYFGSRLMQNLREANGFTYGVVAAMVNLEREGYLAVATQVARDATDRALAEIYREIERLRTEPVAEEELSLVRNMMTGEMMRILDGPFGIADVTIENILCGRRNDVVSENLQRIRAITPAEVQRLAVKYLPREALVTVVAGGPESVL